MFSMKFVVAQVMAFAVGAEARRSRGAKEIFAGVEL